MKQHEIRCFINQKKNRVTLRNQQTFISNPLTSSIHRLCIKMMLQREKESIKLACISSLEITISLRNRQISEKMSLFKIRMLN